MGHALASQFETRVVRERIDGPSATAASFRSGGSGCRRELILDAEGRQPVLRLLSGREAFNVDSELHALDVACARCELELRAAAGDSDEGLLQCAAEGLRALLPGLAGDGLPSEQVLVQQVLRRGHGSLVIIEVMLLSGAAVYLDRYLRQLDEAAASAKIEHLCEAAALVEGCAQDPARCVARSGTATRPHSANPQGRVAADGNRAYRPARAVFPQRPSSASPRDYNAPKLASLRMFLGPSSRPSSAGRDREWSTWSTSFSQASLAADSFMPPSVFRDLADEHPRAVALLENLNETQIPLPSKLDNQLAEAIDRFYDMLTLEHQQHLSIRKSLDLIAPPSHCSEYADKSRTEFIQRLLYEEHRTESGSRIRTELRKSIRQMARFSGVSYASLCARLQFCSDVLKGNHGTLIQVVDGATLEPALTHDGNSELTVVRGTAIEVALAISREDRQRIAGQHGVNHPLSPHPLLALVPEKATVTSLASLLEHAVAVVFLNPQAGSVQLVQLPVAWSDQKRPAGSGGQHSYGTASGCTSKQAFQLLFGTFDDAVGAQAIFLGDRLPIRVLDPPPPDVLRTQLDVALAGLRASSSKRTPQNLSRAARELLSRLEPQRTQARHGKKDSGSEAAAPDCKSLRVLEEVCINRMDLPRLMQHLFSRVPGHLRPPVPTGLHLCGAYHDLDTDLLLLPMPREPYDASERPRLVWHSMDAALEAAGDPDRGLLKPANSFKYCLEVVQRPTGASVCYLEQAVGDGITVSPGGRTMEMGLDNVCLPRGTPIAFRLQVRHAEGCSAWSCLSEECSLIAESEMARLRFELQETLSAARQLASGTMAMDHADLSHVLDRPHLPFFLGSSPRAAVKLKLQLQSDAYATGVPERELARILALQLGEYGVRAEHIDVQLVSRLEAVCLIRVLDPGASVQGVRFALEDSLIESSSSSFLAALGAWSEGSQVEVEWPFARVAEILRYHFGSSPLRAQLAALAREVDAAANRSYLFLQHAFQQEPEDAQRLLALESVATYGATLATRQEAKQLGWEYEDLLRQEEQTLDDFMEAAMQAQLLVKRSIAPGTVWANLAMNCSEEIPWSDRRRIVRDVGLVRGGLAIDPGVVPQAEVARETGDHLDAFQGTFPHCKLLNACRVELAYTSIGALLAGLKTFRETMSEILWMESTFKRPSILGTVGISVGIRVRVSGCRSSTHIGEVRFFLLAKAHLPGAFTQSSSLGAGEPAVERALQAVLASAEICQAEFPDCSAEIEVRHAVSRVLMKELGRTEGGALADAARFRQRALALGDQGALREALARTKLFALLQRSAGWGLEATPEFREAAKFLNAELSLLLRNSFMQQRLKSSCLALETRLCAALEALDREEAGEEEIRELMLALDKARQAQELAGLLDAALLSKARARLADLDHTREEASARMRDGEKGSPGRVPRGLRAAVPKESGCVDPIAQQRVPQLTYSGSLTAGQDKADIGAKHKALVQKVENTIPRQNGNGAAEQDSTRQTSVGAQRDEFGRPGEQPEVKLESGLARSLDPGVTTRTSPSGDSGRREHPANPANVVSAALEAEADQTQEVLPQTTQGLCPCETLLDGVSKRPLRLEAAKALQSNDVASTKLPTSHSSTAVGPLKAQSGAAEAESELPPDRAALGHSADRKKRERAEEDLRDNLHAKDGLLLRKLIGKAAKACADKCLLREARKRLLQLEAVASLRKAMGLNGSPEKLWSAIIEAQAAGADAEFLGEAYSRLAVLEGESRLCAAMRHGTEQELKLALAESQGAGLDPELLDLARDRLAALEDQTVKLVAKFMETRGQIREAIGLAPRKLRTGVIPRCHRPRQC